MSETGTNYKTYKTIDEQIEYLKESKKIIVAALVAVAAIVLAGCSPRRAKLHFFD